MIKFHSASILWHYKYFITTFSDINFLFPHYALLKRIYCSLVVILQIFSFRQPEFIFLSQINFRSVLIFLVLVLDGLSCPATRLFHHDQNFSRLLSQNNIQNQDKTAKTNDRLYYNKRKKRTTKTEKNGLYFFALCHFINVCNKKKIATIQCCGGFSFFLGRFIVLLVCI